MNDFEKTIEIAEYLGCSSEAERLENLCSINENKQFYLTFMGQFSAGKSRLINLLTGKDILPVQRTETTALITTLQYSLLEYAEIIYNNGEFPKHIGLEEVADIWQGNSSYDLQSIEQLKIYTDSPLLKNGIVIVDTPGINTILNEHVRLTVRLIESSARIVYVMGKALTGSDVDFLEKIAGCGVPVMFVRTHMDQVDPHEDNIGTLLQEQARKLEKFSEDKVFFVSDKNSSQFFSGIGELRDHLTDKLSNDVNSLIQEAVYRRASLIVSRLSDVLSGQLTNVRDLLSNNTQKYNAEKKNIEDSLTKMENILAANKSDLGRSISRLRLDAEERLRNDAANYKTALAKQIADMKITSDPQSYMKPTEEKIADVCRKLCRSFSAAYENILKDNRNTLLSELDDCSKLVNISAYIPVSTDEADANIAAIAEKIETLERMKQELEDEMRELDERADSAGEDADAAAARRSEILRGLTAIEEYKPRYKVIEGTHENEKKMRNVGMLLDVALLAVDGAGWVNAGSKVLSAAGKGAKTVKAGKAAKKLTKAAKALKNSEKAAKAIDVVIDCGKLIRQAPNAYEQITNNNDDIEAAPEPVFGSRAEAEKYIDSMESEQEHTSLLDYISIDYYFAKIGKKFDTPSTVVIDTEYEAEYKRRAAELEQRKRTELKEAVEQLNKFELCSDESEKLRNEAEIKAGKAKELAAELAKLRKSIDKKREKVSLDAVREHLIQESAKALDAFADHLLKNVRPVIEEKLENYLNTYDFSVSDDIAFRREELSRLDSEYSSASRAELEAREARLEDFAKILEGVFL